jgi:hypothetical protein
MLTSCRRESEGEKQENNGHDRALKVNECAVEGGVEYECQNIGLACYIPFSRLN